jgi:hypothetical protein
VALVALGFFSARFVNSGSSPAPVPTEPDAPVIAAVRSVQPDPGGTVKISLDETRRRMISGRLDDPSIQRLLLAAARDDNNPGVRVESVDLLRAKSSSAEVRRTLTDVALHDPNPAVRMKALEGLKSYAADPEVRNALAQVVLRDEVPGARILAIDMLTAQRDDSIVGVLQNVVERENNEYVRLRCQKALQEMNASIGTF